MPQQVRNKGKEEIASGTESYCPIIFNIGRKLPCLTVDYFTKQRSLPRGHISNRRKGGRTVIWKYRQLGLYISAKNNNKEASKSVSGVVGEKGSKS